MLLLVFLCFITALLKLGKVSAAPGHLPTALRHDGDQTTKSLQFAVLGDSWASGVAYNLSNVYGPTDRQFCYRTKEAWGAQMADDKDSWVAEDSFSFYFAACGGSMMSEVKKQFEGINKSPNLVWAMFGGNDAHFGSIARACIYQPIDGGHPFGWGPPWDEDNGVSPTGQCKKSLQDFHKFMDDETKMRSQTTRVLDDIFSAAQRGHMAAPAFDLYVSAYVKFFNAETEPCGNWSFAHDKVSVGRPKLVKGLRQVINDNVDKFNKIQAEIIAGYIPPGKGEYLLHHELPSPLFEGHRFCEEGHTFEDQFYHSDVWLWNLQYNDERKDEEKRWVTETDANGTEYISGPAGIDICVPELPPVLTSDASRDDSPVAPQQYGFGWTARPFHPKWKGHEALKDAFIHRMRSDRIWGVKPLESETAASTPSPLPPPPPPQPVEKKNCRGLGDRLYVDRDHMADIISNQFCPEASSNGPISKIYNERTPEEVEVKLNGPADFKPSTQDCIHYLLEHIIDGCDGNNPANPANFKGGGKMAVGEVTYEVQPRAVRQASEDGRRGGCDSTYKGFFNDYVVWGKGWATDDWGGGLKHQLGGCALMSWNFEYGMGSDGREWTAKFRTGVFQRRCVGDAGKSAGAPSDFGCGGSGR